MKQTNIIYRFLATTRNESADEALLTGLDLAEEPYRTAILETIIDRGRPATVAQLIQRYHQMTPVWQELFQKRIDSIAGGIARAADSTESQARRNALTLIWKTRHTSLAESVAALLKDNDPEIARMAANTLLLLTRHHFKADRHLISNDDESVLQGLVMPGKLTERQYLLRALKSAVKGWPVHQHDQVLRAAMFAVPADRQSFWEHTFRPTNRMGQIIREKVQQADHKDMALFVLSSFRVPFLRPACIRALSQSTNPQFILQIADSLNGHLDKEVEQSLKKIRKVNWLKSEIIDLNKLNEKHQIKIIDLIESFSLNPNDIDAYLVPYLNQVAEPIACRILETLAMRPDEFSLLALDYCLKSPFESVAVMAMKQLLHCRPPQFRKLIIQNLNSTHGAVRELAGNYYRQVAFDSFWNSFERLSLPQQKNAGHAVFKIDPQAHDRWREKVSDPRQEIRLKTLKIARTLGLISQHEDKICTLARDPSPRIRSGAIAALGQIQGNLTQTAQQCIMDSLNDMDNRVRANAIEAIGRKNIQQARRDIASLINDPDNRVRANAIQVLLKWKSENARAAIKTMLADQRPAHQHSARWLLNKTLASLRPQAQKPDKPIEPVRFPSFSIQDLLKKNTPRPEPLNVH